MAIYDKMAIFALEKIRKQNKFNMTISGTISVAMPEQSGTSKSGKPWRKREYVCVYDNSNANYPKSVVFQVMNDFIDKLNIQQGVEYDLEIDFESREWNGRYFLQASCWKATTKSQPAQQSQSETPTLDSMGVKGYQGQQAAPSDDGDLPF